MIKMIDWAWPTEQTYLTSADSTQHRYTVSELMQNNGDIAHVQIPLHHSFILIEWLLSYL